MILKRQKARIIKIIGKHYSAPILEFLKKKNITTKRGTPYTSSYIRMVICGIEENRVIENAVLELCKQEIDKKRALELSKEKILKNQLAS